jgi:hypothetical protein
LLGFHQAIYEIFPIEGMYQEMVSFLDCGKTAGKKQKRKNAIS